MPDTVYDWWSGHQRLFRALSWLVFRGRETRLRETARERLFAGAGDRVLDLGCGPGRSFAPLASAAGPTGQVVGLDYSAGMVRQATQRARTSTTESHAVRGDAASLPFSTDSFDRVYSTLAVSAMGDVEGVAREVRRVLRPGGRCVVFDTRPFQQSPWRALNPALNRVSSWATEWHPERDVVGALESTFDHVDTETWLGGTTFVSVAVVAEDAATAD